VGARPPVVSDSSTLVVRAGPAGLAAALALRRRGLDVLVIEAGDRGVIQSGDTLRPDGKRLLRDLGVADTQFERCRVESHGIDAAWSGAEIDGQDFIVEPYGPPWHLERPAFDRTLATAAEGAGVSFLRGAGLTSLDRNNGISRNRRDRRRCRHACRALFDRRNGPRRAHRAPPWREASHL